MNESVHDAVFFPFIPDRTGAPSGRLARAGRCGTGWFAGACAVYLVFGMGLALAAKVTMNEMLRSIAVPDSRAAAAQIWADDSPRRQIFNQVRTVASGAAPMLAGAGLCRLQVVNRYS